MTGNNYNRNMKKGQVLLILVMLLSTAFTVVLTATYQSVTETQLTKLEEENQKTLAAAEAGIEAVLRQKTTVNIANLPNLNNFSGQALIQNTQTNQFTTPLIYKDEQYTFYLAPYNPQTNSFLDNSIPQSINICFGDQNYNPAIEITLIKSDNSIRRYAINPFSDNIINNGLNASSPNSQDCPSDFQFRNRYQITASEISTNSRIMIFRVIHTSLGSTKIGLRASSPFPPQGTTIISTARSTTGVEKKIQLFQSYPQIPSEFFVTSF